MRRTWLQAMLCAVMVGLIVAGAFGSGPDLAMAEPVVAFEMDDPTGDDYGPGAYVYPTHKAFVPGLFDLTGFRVSYDAQHVYFDATFREVTNPWNAPEGFSHQLINIYIDTARAAGRTDILRKGAAVAFDKKHGWDLFIKALGWGGCRVFTSEDDAESRGISDGLAAGILPDGKTIRITVPRSIVGEPDKSWGYYVLIGSQDAFGEDDFRPVMENAGPWVFGGGSNLEVNPNVIDMLAPPGGRLSQEKLLGSYNVSRGTLAVLLPVSGSTRSGMAPTLQTAGILAVILIGGAALTWWIRRRGAGIPPRS